MSWIAIALLVPVIALASGEPSLDVSAVVSAADHKGGKVSPGEIVVLFPSSAGPEVLAGSQQDEHGIATVLAETRVYFDEFAAPLAYVVRGEIGAVVPYEVAGRTSTNIVVEYQGRKSAPVPLPVKPSNPSIFTQDRLGTGQAGILNDTGCCNSVKNPAVRGSIAAVYATGEGLLRGKIATGNISAYRTPADYPTPRLPVRLTVGGIPAELYYIGAAPHAVAGLLQINFRIPWNAPVGDAVPLVLTVGQSSSSPIATMAIRAIQDQILVVTDDARFRQRWTLMLKGAGYRVFTAENAENAAALASDHPLDLVVMDLHSVPEFQSSMQAMRRERPQLKLIAALNGIQSEDLRSADLLDAQAVVERSLDAGRLLPRVRELLRRRIFVYDAGDPWPLAGKQPFGPPLPSKPR